MNTKPIGLLALLMTALLAAVPTASADPGDMFADPPITAKPSCDPNHPDVVMATSCRAEYATWILYEAFLKPVDEVYDCVVEGECPFEGPL